MYKIHKSGWSAATKQQISRFAKENFENGAVITCEITGNDILIESLETGFDFFFRLTHEGLLKNNLYMAKGFNLWALEVGLLGKAQLEWVRRDDYSQRSDHYYAFVPINKDGSAGFVLQAAYTYAWKGKPEVFQIAIYAVAHDKPIDISKNCIGPCLLHEVLDGMTYLDQPAPMIEAEQALRQILKGGLNQLQFTV